MKFRHPFYDRASPIHLGDFVTLEHGTGIVHSSPAYGIEDFQSCRKYGMKDDDIINPVGGDGRYAGSLPFFGGVKIWKANPQIVDKMRDAGALLHATQYTHSYMHCWRHKTPIIYRATTQWFAGMDAVPGWHGHVPPEPLRVVGAARHRRHRFLSGVGQGAPVRNDRQSPRLDAFAAAAVGRADAVLHGQGNRPAAPGHAGAAGTCREQDRAAAASKSWFAATHEDCSGSTPRSTAS